MRKKLLILFMTLLLFTSFAFAAYAARVDNDTHTVLDLLYKMTIEHTDFYIVKMSHYDSSTECLRLDTTKVSKGTNYECFTFDKDNAFKAQENQLRWIVKNSILNGNITLSELKDNINALAKKNNSIQYIKGDLRMEEAVTGTQMAILNKAVTTVSKDSRHSSCRNICAVYLYYSYMIESGASLDAPVPQKLDPKISFTNDTVTPIVTKTIKGIEYKVLPYNLKSTNKPILTLSSAPKDSFIDDVKETSFNVYVPIKSLPDPTFANITIDGSCTAETTYKDICTYSSIAVKCTSTLLGEHDYKQQKTAKYSHTAKWVLPAEFCYELTLLGKQSGSPVKGVDFTFTNNGDISITKTTDASGKITLKSIPCGDFFLQIDKTSASRAMLDISVDDYGLFTSTTGISMNVTKKGAYKLQLEISEMPASITFYKYCDISRLPLPFAVFGLFEDDANKPFIQATSDKNGMVVFNNLYPGAVSQYNIKETTNPVGYKGSYSNTIKLTRGQNLSFGDMQCVEAAELKKTLEQEDRLKCFGGIIFNHPIKMNITAYVKDKLNDAPLKDTEVAIYKGDYSESDIPSTAVPLVYGNTDSNGKIVFSKIMFNPAKQYTLVHTKTLSGYDIDTSKYLMNLSTIQTTTEYTFLDTPQKGTIKVVIDTTKPSSYYDGCEFLLIGAPEYPSQNQLKPGTIASLKTEYNDLLPGTYKLHQVLAPKQYTEADTIDLGISVTLPAGDTKTITLKDKDLCQDGFISLTKVDDKGKPVQGAVFELYKGSPTQFANFTKAQATQQLLSTKTTDSTGIIVFGQFMPGEYTIVEKSAPAGYMMGAETVFNASFEEGNINIGPIVNTIITPTPSPTATAKPTPKPTATLPPGTVATGESSFLYILAAVLAVLGTVGFIFRKKIGELF